MKNGKKIAIILYAAYATMLVFAIMFGRSISNTITAALEEIFHEKNITDVTVDIPADTELMAGRYYYPEYEAHGSFLGTPGLNYTSLDPEVLKVSDSGAIIASMDFEGDVTDARLKVTSAYDDSLEKVFSFRFVKKYPEGLSVSYFVMGHSVGASELYVGVPVYVFPIITSSSDYNVTDYELVYDKEKFTLAADGALIPTVAGAHCTLGIRYDNGLHASTEPLRICEAPEVTDFDEVRMNGIPSTEFVGKKGENIKLSLYKDGGLVATDFTISLAKTGDAKRDGEGGMRFLSTGEKGMTITLPNGFAKTVEFSIVNTVALPTVKDGTVRDTHVIDMLTTDSETFTFYFTTDVSYDTVTYEYDSSMVRLSSSSRAFTVRAKQSGTTEIKVIVDDGTTRLVDTYTVNIKTDYRIFSLIYENIGTFVSKVMGHLACFALLAFFAMNMFRYVSVENKIQRSVLYTLCALPIASVTELLQLLIPERVGRFADVMIDMLGYYLGTVAFIVLFCIVRKAPAVIKKISSKIKKTGESGENA